MEGPTTTMATIKGRCKRICSNKTSQTFSEIIISLASVSFLLAAFTLSELPLPPQNFRLDSRTSDTFTVKWDFVKLSKSFELVTTKSSSNNSKNSRTITKSSQHNLATVDGLQPDTKYLIKIRTRSLTGFGNFTDQLEIKTMTSGNYKSVSFFIFRAKRMIGKQVIVDSR